MTTDIKELVQRLKRTVYRSDWDDTIVYANPDGVAAASALEAMAGEIARLNAECCRCGQPTTALCKAAQAAEAERDRLKNALRKMTEFHHSTSEKVAIARKALGDA